MPAMLCCTQPPYSESRCREIQPHHPLSATVSTRRPAPALRAKLKAPWLLHLLAAASARVKHALGPGRQRGAHGRAAPCISRCRRIVVQAGAQSKKRGAITRVMVAIILISTCSEGPAVSLNGSPTAAVGGGGSNSTGVGCEGVSR
jgi:hypothetical protein